MALGLRRPLTVLALGSIAFACRSQGTSAPPPAPPQVAATPTSSANAAVHAPEETPLQLGPRSRQFLVRDVKAGQVLLMSSETEASRMIARAASGLYQAEVGLFWYRDGSELKVLDLNAADSSAVTVADGLPKIDRFAIIDHAAEAYVDDGCDELPTLQLKWTADPSFDFFEEGVEPQITNRDWLKRELERKPREVGEYQELSDGGGRARVPKRLLSCDCCKRWSKSGRRINNTSLARVCLQSSWTN